MIKEYIIPVEMNKWLGWLGAMSRVDGAYLIRISDDVLDEEDWAIHSIHVEGGVVKSQKKIYPGVYGLPSFEGKSFKEVLKWVRCEDGVNSHPRNEHEIMKLI